MKVTLFLKLVSLSLLLLSLPSVQSLSHSGWAENERITQTQLSDSSNVTFLYPPVSPYIVPQSLHNPPHPGCVPLRNAQRI